MESFVDTSVLVYAYDTADPEKRERALAVLASAQGGGHVLSTQVLNEFYVVVTRPGRSLLSREEAREVVDRFAAAGVEPVDGDLVQRALRLHRDHSVSYWDALVVAAAARSGCARLLTEDLAHGTVIDGVRIDNPFR